MEKPVLVELDQLLEKKQLAPFFQTIWDIQTLVPLGWEALIRGPDGSSLASPRQLFTAAREVGRLAELDLTCRELAIRFFCSNRPPGYFPRLFLNVEPTVIADQSYEEQILNYLNENGILPQHVVIELTEASYKKIEYDQIIEAYHHYRAQGFAIAIDDFGSGISSLRLWSEVRPDFIKIDQHIIERGIYDAAARRFLEAAVSLSSVTNSSVIGEGVETLPQLELMRQLGIRYAQGFLLSPPSPTIVVKLSPQLWQELAPKNNALGRSALSLDRRTIEVLIDAIEPVTLETCNEVVFHRFTKCETTYAIPVVDKENRPLGVIPRHQFLEDFARPYRHELFGRKSCHHYLQKALTVPETITLRELSSRFQSLDPEHLGHPFIITSVDGFYRGLGSGQALLKELVSLQLKTARYANPLTGLPGNVPINETIDLYLSRKIPFVVCYIDISNFKAYNDCYGFTRGDEMIAFVADLLQRYAVYPDDFVGHIGGDDFIVLWANPNWEQQIESLFSAFSAAIPTFYTAEDWERGGIEAEDRLGNRILHPVSSLTAGALPIVPGVFSSHHAVGSAASAAKKMAKLKSKELVQLGVKPANALFIERRRAPSS